MKKSAAFGLLVILQALSAEKLREAKFPLNFAPEKSVTVTIELSEGFAQALFAGGKKQKLSAFDSAGAGEDAPALLVGDFNFDGHNDIAILEGNGYGGVNLYYRVWLWQSESRDFAEFSTSVGNPVLNRQSRMLISAHRSGPRWYQSVYAANAGKLVPYAEAQMLDAAAFWGVIFSDGRRAVAAANWFDGDMHKAPQATAEIVAGKCAGVKKQKARNPTQKKSRIMLVDFREDGSEVLARFEEKSSPRWISAGCLLSK